MRRLSKVKIEWNLNFAYAIGLIATDGCLSNDSRHIDFTSKDKEIVIKFKKCLGIKNKIGIKFRGNDGYRKNKYFRIQFGDRNFYNFLLSIGLSPKKSKIISSLKIPDKFFIDFLRGCIDGDGTIGSFRHPESIYPQLRVRLFSASYDFLYWIKNQIAIVLKIKNGWIEKKKSGEYRLVYAKSDSIKLLNFLYRRSNCYLVRKYVLAKPFLRV